MARRGEEVTRADDRLIGEVKLQVERAVNAAPYQWFHSLRERIPTIRKFTPGTEFSRPKAVTIGPYHMHDTTSITMNDKRLIVHLMNHLYKLDLAARILKVKNQVKDALKLYSDTPGRFAFEAGAAYSDTLESLCFEDDAKFAELLLLDSYFILFVLISGEILPRLSEIKRDSLITSNPPSKEDLEFHFVMDRSVDLLLQRDKIALDLLIVDNQIPFFVIEGLFKELESLETPLIAYALRFFKIIHPKLKRPHEGMKRPSKFLHLLHLFHWSRVPVDKYEVLPSDHFKLNGELYTPTAVELQESATMFKHETSGSSLDITFRRGRLIPVVGVLNIPKLHIHDYSSSVFHNLIAFEMQFSFRGCCTMAFSAFMGNLLQREEDARLLRQCGVLASASMTDREVVDLFKSLSRLTENYPMPGDLHATYEQILSHHRRPISRFCGSIILKYFPNPLVTLSVFAATMLFILALLQTAYTALDYYHS